MLDALAGLGLLCLAFVVYAAITVIQRKAGERRTKPSDAVPPSRDQRQP
jgi:hypothetical protein